MVLSADTTVENRGVELFSSIQEMTFLSLPSDLAISLALMFELMAMCFSFWCLAWHSFLHCVRTSRIRRVSWWVVVGAKSGMHGYVGNSFLMIV